MWFRLDNNDRDDGFDDGNTLTSTPMTVSLYINYNILHIEYNFKSGENMRITNAALYNYVAIEFGLILYTCIL